MARNMLFIVCGALIMSCNSPKPMVTPLAEETHGNQVVQLSSPLVPVAGGPAQPTYSLPALTVYTGRDGLEGLRARVDITEKRPDGSSLLIGINFCDATKLAKSADSFGTGTAHIGPYELYLPSEMLPLMLNVLNNATISYHPHDAKGTGQDIGEIKKP